MSDELHRLVVRSEMTTGEDGTFTGRLVPYEQPVQLAPELWEQMKPGVFAAQVRATESGRSVVKVRHEHGEVIGHFTDLIEREDGLYGTGRIVDTARGRDTLALLRAGSVDQLSVGFHPKHTDRVPHENGTMLVRNSGTLRECSVVWAGAYGDGAVVTAVRNEQPDTAREDTLQRLRSLTA